MPKPDGGVRPVKLQIPEFSLVVLIGTTGSGKSSFARKHFLQTQVLSSDTYRGFLSDDENDQTITPHAFEALHYMLGKRLQLGRLTVVDATNVQAANRKSLTAIGSKWHALKVAIILDVPERTCADRNQERADRAFGPHVLRNQRNDLRRTFSEIKREGFHKIYILKPEDIESAELVTERIWSRRLDEHGPFDIVGDVHGCLAELQELVGKLGYEGDESWSHPTGRKLFFVGDLVDRGPDSTRVLRRVMKTVQEGNAFCVPGNHDVKLAKALSGSKVNLSHGLEQTMAQLAEETPEFRLEVAQFIDSLVSHALLDGGNLCVAHAGLREEMQGRGSKVVREFALYGETTGEIDEFGLPVRYQWAKEYRGKALVVFGHTPVPSAEFFNNTIDLDTGCCFGGKLTALRYPEREVVSVPALATYAEPVRSIQAQAVAVVDDLLDISDVIGRRGIESRLDGRITIREENAIAALEVMSRFAADPRWLIYLPPTMSPCETSNRDGFLEYPTQALDYYRGARVESVVCEEKHMGSRAVAVVCRDAETAFKRFRVDTGETGIVTTRTGRRFFDDSVLEAEILRRMASACEASGVFDRLSSPWLLIDLELMPWSAKAVGLLREQYAPVAASASTQASVLSEVAAKLASRGLDSEGTYAEMAAGRKATSEAFRAAYRRYCWSVGSIDDLKLAPFHLLASEGKVHTDMTHQWHMGILADLCDADTSLFRKTPYRMVSLESETEVQDLCARWESLVAAGGEGMVVKPMDFMVRTARSFIQPAVKCRGPEYLRLIYGPEYLEPQNLQRLRTRSLSRKRALARSEFSLGIEAMERFVQGESLRRVHECVFGILALESEPVDPRL